MCELQLMLVQDVNKSKSSLICISTKHKHYQSKYHTVGHRCSRPGCGEVLVLDGNMKNNREVCYAVEAGYAEFSGLPGRIQTGCPNTPAIKSRYCPVHAPITATPQDIQFSEDGNPVVTHVSTSTEERHAAIVVSKRITRTSTFYQVINYFNFISIIMIQMHVLVCMLSGGVARKTHCKEHMGARIMSS